MDTAVEEALAKWPNVPAVYGWLSLDERGRWRLHPQGDAAAGEPGESITNPQIVGFMHRNYAADVQGRWFFQNGPQRVYVRLDAAPYVLRLADDGIGLMTHTGQSAGAVTGWWLDESGRLYAQTDLGPAMVDGRDLAALLDLLTAADGRPLGEVLDSLDPAALLTHPALPAAAPLHCNVTRAEIPARMGFVPLPRP